MPTTIEMPKLSDTMTVGTLINWLKKEGDKVSSGDRIAEIETDKATMEMEVFEDGVLLKHFVAAGEQVAVGDPICAVGKAGEKVEAPARKTGPQPPAKTEEPAKPAAKATATPATPPPLPVASTTAPVPTPATSESPLGERIKISPLARRLAAEKGVELSSIQGTGPGGRIIRADVETAATAPKPAPTPSAAPALAPSLAAAVPTIGTSAAPIQEDKLVAVSNMRATIARRLVESKSQIPHFYLEIEIDAGPLMKLREQVNAAFGEAAKVSVNDFILKACAHALRRVPAANCSWEANGVRQHGAANVSFAVAIDDGLITPVIFNAHAKTIFQISAEARALAAKAKAKKLQPAEFTGGTFCVSNLGMFGITRFSAIINPPNGAILAVGTTVKKPVVNEAGEIVVGQRMALTLSCDHRVVDGAIGAQFLAALRDILEKPLLVLG